MSEETWKDIEGYEGKYQVSSEGKVRSLNYNNTGKIQELKQKVNRYGYMEVKLSKNNKCKDFLVSTLVGKAFLRNNNSDKIIAHISNDITNNNVSNLKYVYQSEMLFNTYKRGRRKGIPSDNTISFNNKSYKKKSDIVKDYNLKPNQLSKRIANGWTLEEALKIPMHLLKGGGAKLYRYEGQLKTIKQIAEENNLNHNFLRKRLARGWSIEEAVSIPKLR